jgi:hypothetical protein
VPEGVEPRFGNVKRLEEWPQLALTVHIRVPGRSCGGCKPERAEEYRTRFKDRAALYKDGAVQIDKVREYKEATQMISTEWVSANRCN